VASVSSGLVTAIAPGTSVIRATSEGQSGEVTANVTPYPWAATGSMLTGRTLHSATLLGNGKVLVCGGQNLTAPIQLYASCELYDPATGAWSATGSLATARESHTAIRLQDGKVLVTGGNDLTGTALVSSELYDPASGTWTATGSLGTARVTDAVLLADGRVLVAGGSNPGTTGNTNAIASTEIYDPATGTWSAAAPLAAARSGRTLTLLGNGMVLVAGGASGPFTSPTLVAGAELFDPAAGTWSAAGSLATPRGFHRSVLLGNGRVVVIGGTNLTTTVFSRTELFNPSPPAWTLAGDLVVPRSSHSASVLPNGKVLVVGGSGTGLPVNSSELFDPVANTWSSGPAMTQARLNHTAVVLANGKVLVMGGQPIAALPTAEIYDPAVPFPSGPGFAIIRRP
jgi:N-acetylneuraminic acid mutarotase